MNHFTKNLQYIQYNAAVALIVQLLRSVLKNYVLSPLNQEVG